MHGKILMNEGIVFPQMLVIMDNGDKVGVVTRQKALSLAKEKGLDLVLVSEPKKGQDAVCKIFDYSKMMYKQQKTQKHQKSATDIIKEIRISYNIADHDLETKNNAVKRFLGKRYRVKYVMRLSGREKKMTKEALDRFNNVLSGSFADIASWDPVKISGSEKNLDITTMLHAVTIKE